MPKAKSTRSRNGCNACKKARIKCDETKPACSRCRQKNVECTYTFQLQFREDLENRGSAFGREGIWRKLPSRPQVSLGLETQLKDAYFLPISSETYHFIVYNDLSGIPKSPAYSVAPLDILNSLASTHLSDESDFSRVVLRSAHCSAQYLTDFICPARNLSTLSLDSSVDYSELFQYCYSHSHLYYLLLALGALYQSRVFHLQGDLRQKQLWKSWSLRLKRHGEQYITAKCVAGDLTLDLLLGLTFLVIFEIGNNCDLNWTKHLKFTCEMMKHRFRDPQISTQLYSQNRIFKFIIEFLVYQESLGRTACQDVSVLVEIAEQLGLKQNRTLVPWMGCSTSLVDVISDITDLSFEKHRWKLQPEMYAEMCRTLEQTLQTYEVELDLDAVIGRESESVVPVNGSLILPVSEPKPRQTPRQKLTELEPVDSVDGVDSVGTVGTVGSVDPLSSAMAEMETRGGTGGGPGDAAAGFHVARAGFDAFGSPHSEFALSESSCFSPYESCSPNVSFELSVAAEPSPAVCLHDSDAFSLDCFTDFEAMVRLSEGSSGQEVLRGSGSVSEEMAHNSDELCFLISSEVKRLSTLVFYYCAVCDKSPEDAEIQQLVRKILGYIRYVVLDKKKLWGSFFLWPIFICGSEISSRSKDCEELRALCLDLLQQLELHTLGNLGSVRSIIVSIWAKRDLADDMKNSCGCNVNDWNLYIADVNYRISLA